MERIDEWAAFISRGREKNLCRQGAHFQTVGGGGEGREAGGGREKTSIFGLCAELPPVYFSFRSATPLPLAPTFFFPGTLAKVAMTMSHS